MLGERIYGLIDALLDRPGTTAVLVRRLDDRVDIKVLVRGLTASIANDYLSLYNRSAEVWKGRQDLFVVTEAADADQAEPGEGVDIVLRR